MFEAEEDCFLLVVVEGEGEVKVKRTDVVDSHFGLLFW